jgi:hypothetical protein
VILARHLEELGHLVHGDLRGDLARRVPAHAVGHHQKTLLGQQEEVVLIVVPLHPDVGLTGNVDLHGRRKHVLNRGVKQLVPTWSKRIR